MHSFGNSWCHENNSSKNLFLSEVAAVNYVTLMSIKHFSDMTQF